MSAPISSYLLKYWLFPHRFHFEQELKNPESSQRRVLSQIVSELSDANYGQIFKVKPSDTYKEYAEKIPVIQYAQLRHWIDRQKIHQTSLLVDEPIIRYEFDRESNLIPYTKSLERSFFNYFATQAALAEPNQIDNSSQAYYRSKWSTKFADFPISLLEPKQPYYVEAPILIKAPQTEHCLPFLPEVFFEFIDDQKKIFRVHELAKNKIYGVIVSQKSGLYRYQLNTKVQVSKGYRNTPSFKVVHDTGSNFGQTVA